MFLLNSQKADFPSVAGVIDEAEVAMDNDEQSVKTVKDKKVFIDTVSIKVPRKGMEMTSFLRDGMGLLLPFFPFITSTEFVYSFLDLSGFLFQLVLLAIQCTGHITGKFQPRGFESSREAQIIPEYAWARYLHHSAFWY